MKKLTRKLFLSVAALGACAVTLVSTTFAWYTTNSSVDLEEMSAATEMTSGDSQLYVATAYSYDAGKAATAFNNYSAVGTPVNVVGGSNENPLGNTTLKPVYSKLGDYVTISKSSKNYKYTAVQLNAGFVAGTTYYEYAEGVYKVTADTQVDPYKTYYILKDEAKAAKDAFDAANGEEANYDEIVEAYKTYVDPATGEYLTAAYQSENVLGSYDSKKTYFYATGFTAATEYNVNVLYYEQNDSKYVLVADQSSVNADNVEDYFVASYEKATLFGTETYYTREQIYDTVEYANEVNGNVLEYVLRFRTTTAHSSAVPVYLSAFSITSAGYNNSAQTALAVSGTTGIQKAGTFNVDILKALKMDVYETVITNADGENAYYSAYGSTARTSEVEASFTGADEEALTYTPTLNKTFKTYGFTAFADNADNNVIVTAENNAIGYYNKVAGTNVNRETNAVDYKPTIELDTVAAGSGKVSLFSIPATSNYVEVRFVFYLDGWDEYCYDVCRNQRFYISMSFSTKEAEGVLTTATLEDGQI